jgi:hypothetical protein
MGNGGASKGDVKYVALGVFGAFLNCEWHFTGLAITQTDTAGLVTDHDDGSKLEATTALHYFGNTVDVHHARLTEFAWLCLGAWLTAFAWSTLTTVAVAGCLGLLYVGH